MTKEELHALRVAKVKLKNEYQDKKDINPEYQDRRLGAKIAAVSRKLNDYARAEEDQVLEDRRKAILLLEDLKHFLRGNTTAYNKANDIYFLLTNKTRGY